LTDPLETSRTTLQLSQFENPCLLRRSNYTFGVGLAQAPGWDPYGKITSTHGIEYLLNAAATPPTFAFLLAVPND
jgi:hypothetical protein